jgi:hypothetical protein
VRDPIASSAKKAKLLVGTCSWTDPTLVESGWYPERIKDNADKRLRYYAEHFPIVENDAAFYALPAQKQAELWAERTPDEFVMNFKAFATLTTHHTDPKRLPKDIREALSKEAAAKKRIYPKDFPKDAREELFAKRGSSARSCCSTPNGSRSRKSTKRRSSKHASFCLTIGSRWNLGTRPG